MELFDRLEIIDLFKMFDVNKRCRRVIKDSRFKINKLFDLPDLRKEANEEWIFKIFGERMTKLKITGEEIVVLFPRYSSDMKFIRLMETYCAKGKLTELIIVYPLPEDFSSYAQLCPLNAIRIFQNIVSLQLPIIFYRTLRHFFNPDLMKNLHKLEVRGYMSSENWLQLSTKQNLEHLSVGNITISKEIIISIEIFLKTHPNLKTFRYRSPVDPVVPKMLAKYALNLENSGSVSVRDKGYLEKFSKLKCLELETRIDGNDLLKILDCVVAKQMLEALVINFYESYRTEESHNPVEPTMIKQFTNLTHLYLNLGEKESLFLQNVLPHFITLKKVIFKGIYQKLNQTNILKSIQVLKNVRVFVIPNTLRQNLKIPPELYQNLVEAWRQKQQAESLDYPIKICLDRNTVKAWRAEIGEKYDDNFVVLETISDWDLKYDALISYDF